MKTIFTNCNIVDVENRAVLTGKEIFVQDGVIKAIDCISDRDGCQLVDLAGMTVMPGLFNCHTHMTMMPLANPEVDAATSTVGHTLIALGHLQAHIESGVTFIRDVGAHDNIDIEIRDAGKRGLVTMAPDMQVSGNCICMTGGHGWSSIGYQADGEDMCRKAARLQLRKGVDWIKVMATGGVMTRGVEPGSPQLSVAEMKVIVEEAHKVGVRTCTHAQGRQGIKNALMAGIDCIEHGCFLDDESIEMMKRNQTWFVPTLCAPYFINKYAMGAGIPDFVVRKNNLVNDAHKKSFKRAFDEGINIACGTDAGTPYNAHSGTGMELVLMVENGLTPMDALIIATLRSAQLCGVEQELGSIAVGKKAHFAVFKEDPTQHIDTVLDCRMTVKNGEILFRAAV